MTASDVIFWLASNVEFWRPIAIFFLAGFAVGILSAAYGAWEDL
jgi:hypothetical protein